MRTRPRTGWLEPIERGIHRAHRATCPTTPDRQRGHRCDCPYTYWKPRTATTKRERARIHGTLADTRRAKRQAEQNAEQHRRTRTNQRAGIIPMPTLDQWYEQVMQRRWSTMRLPTQHRRQRDYALRIQPHLGTQRIDRITAQSIEAWLYAMIDRDGNRRACQMAFQTLRDLLALAVKQSLLPVNPADAVEYPTHGLHAKQPRVLTRAEYDRLLAACPALRTRTMIRAMCEAGLRRSEIAGLHHADLDLDAGYIHIRRRVVEIAGVVDVNTPKSRTSRITAISNTFTSELRDYLATIADTAPDTPVWPRTEPSRAPGLATSPYISGSIITATVNRAARRAGLLDPDGKPWPSPHKLRATGASLAVAAGVPEHLAQRQLGHARIETTRKHYLHLPVVEPLRAIGAVFELKPLRTS